MAAMSKIAAWAGVARAPFLLLPVTLVAAGVAAAAYDDRAYILPSVLALIGLVALHAAVNAFNEASDMQTGIDLHTARTPFSGGSGTLPSGALSVGGARGVGTAGSIIGLAMGLYFLVRVGWWPLSLVMAIGAVSVLTYTNVFARVGLGEIFAGLGLGLLPVIGTALVQRGVVGPAAWAAGIPACLMTFNLLLLNEFPDELADRAGGRRNLVLLLGRRSGGTGRSGGAPRVPGGALSLARRAPPPAAPGRGGPGSRPPGPPPAPARAPPRGARGAGPRGAPRTGGRRPAA